jgi:hypothetical protein
MFPCQNVYHRGASRCGTHITKPGRLSSAHVRPRVKARLERGEDNPGAVLFLAARPSGTIAP